MKIIKRDKSIEDFDINKIVRVVKAAGLNDEETKALKHEVEFWMSHLKCDEIISNDIRNKICDELKKHNQYAAQLYQWYEKSKYTNQKTE